MEWSDRVGRRIKLRDLHVLQAVAQQGSMAKAARFLAVSQPVISKVIADLERELGVPLLDRDRHGAEPTVYGASLLKHGVAVFDELRRSIKEIEFLTDPAKGELRIGSTDVMAAGFLPAVLKAMHRQHPHLAVHVRQTAVVASLYRDLREREVDLVVARLGTPLVDNDLSAEVVFKDTTVIVAGRHSKWSRRRKLRLADLIEEPWILPAPGSAAEALTFEMFRSSGLPVPTRGVVRASVQMHNALVAKGPYLATSPGSMVHFGGMHPAIKVLPVATNVPPGPIAIVTVKRRTTSAIAGLFFQHAREVAKRLA